MGNLPLRGQNLLNVEIGLRKSECFFGTTNGTNKRMARICRMKNSRTATRSWEPRWLAWKAVRLTTLATLLIIVCWDEIASVNFGREKFLTTSLSPHDDAAGSIASGGMLLSVQHVAITWNLVGIPRRLGDGVLTRAGDPCYGA